MSEVNVPKYLHLKAMLMLRLPGFRFLVCCQLGCQGHLMISHRGMLILCWLYSRTAVHQ